MQGGKSREYGKYEAGFSKKPLCGIYALHVLTGLTVKHWFNKYKREYGKSDKWRGATTEWGILNLLRKRNVKMKVNATPKSTLATFVDMECAMKDTWLILLNNHWIVIKEQMVIDQGGIRFVDDHWGKRKRIQKAIKIGGR